MKNHRFPWLRNRTTDNRKCEKARNIKEKRTIEMFSPASRLPVARLSSASAKRFLFALWGKRPAVFSQWKAPGMGAFLLPFFDKIPPIILVYEKLGEKRPLPPVVGAVPLFHKKGRFLRKTTRTVSFPAPLPHQAGIFLRK